MTRVLLVNMPFASLSMSSLALTQLKAVVPAEVLYLNHDFAKYIGDREAYRHVLSNHGFMTGIGDWFFRQIAFPDAPDNTSEYFERYYTGSKDIWERLIKYRAGLDTFLDSLIVKYRMVEADVVGFTALFAQTFASFAMARRLKLANPKLTIVMGGAACSGEMGEEYAKQVDWIDHFFTGPGLVSFPKFVAGDISDRVICGDDLDIDADVPLDYGSFLGSLDPEIEPVLLFETSRGCWWATKQVCTFCGLNGPSLTYRAMSPEKALAQFDALFKYVPRCKFFSGVDTILPNNYLKDVIPSLRPPPGVKIQYELRAQFREEDLEKLCAAGITVLQPGIESLSTATLKLMKKGISAFQNLRFLKACSKFPVEVGWNLLIYSPGESEETYERYLRLIPLLAHLHPPQAVSLIGFVRYSEYFQHAREFGLELRPEDHYRLTFPFDEPALERIAVKFQDVNAPVEQQNDWLVRLNNAVAGWRRLWLNQARLCLAGNVLYDSRSGEPVQYTLDARMLAALELLEQPRTAVEIGAPLAFLRERGLVFEEDGRYLSLVS